MTGTTAAQYPLPFAHRPSLSGQDFLVGPANAEAVAWIDRWPDWPGPALLVAGAPGAGKTHLSSVFAAQSGARQITIGELAGKHAAELGAGPALILDDAAAVAGNPRAETALFHLFNHLRSERGRLLLTARLAPARWPVVLPDLASRLNAVPVAAILPPDEALLSAVLVKLFDDRQLKVGADVVRYMVPRMERSFDAARRLVTEIDRLSLARRREVTVPLVRDLLA